MTKRPGRSTVRRERRATQREAEQRQAALAAQSARRRRLLVRGAIAVGTLLAGVIVVLTVIGDPGAAPAPSVPRPAPVTNGYGAATAPPWPAPADPAPGMGAAGLPVSDMSAMAQHFHAHLDVIVNGAPVSVPADLGVDRAGGQMSALHTHDSSGLIHIESSDPAGRYVLGQLFNEWNVALDATRVGGLAVGPGTSLRTFVNGAEVPGNPAALELREHQQIALVYGPAGAPVLPPADYDFSNA